jgi:superfamily I DNA/RNA helicase
MTAAFPGTGKTRMLTHRVAHLGAMIKRNTQKAYN